MNTFSLAYLDDIYEKFTSDPESVPVEWRRYFENYPAFLSSPHANGHGHGNGTFEPVASEFHAASELNGEEEASPFAVAVAPQPDPARAMLVQTEQMLSRAQAQDRVDQLVRGYRNRGHLKADIDPLGMPRPSHQELTPGHYGLGVEHLDQFFSTDSIEGSTVATLGQILDRMENTYCRSIGVQLMHIDDVACRQWLQRRMERTENRLELTRETQVRILTRLTDALIFEEFMRRRFTGAKTFSLEGAETLIPLLDLALERAGEQGLNQVVMAMAHRGRINVLANIFGKRATNIFWTFEDPKPERHRGGGDVRYHLGFSSDYRTRAGKNLHLSLCFNPSHLEFVNPVALGRVRAKQDRAGDAAREQAMAILIHGDASFAGEGVVQETLNLSELEAYRTGGALHVLINNQVGFTTPPEDARSNRYATDVAKMLEAPIFHVNGEDPEAVAQVISLAMDFRREFHRDVVVDMYCYRKLGHNEGDEPRFTQPVMYRIIDARPPVREKYLERLLALGGITQEEADAIAERRKTQLEREFELAKKEEFRSDDDPNKGIWYGYFGGPEPADVDPTAIPVDQAKRLLSRINHVPADFHLNRKLERAYALRKEMEQGQRPLDWATAELLALGSFAESGIRVRLTGQDVERGTFSQRHAVLFDEESGKPYSILQHLSDDQAPVEICNSPLSEVAVMGFEYGYSLDAPDAFVAWEAQFGDFWNVAQVIVDQFICSAEDKWKRLSGVTLLLPHGFEGQGPEHASARLERLLMLSAEHNIQVTQPTTPAQYFHLLRRQMVRKWRKPLIVLTPKSLLRHPRVVSDLHEFTDGTFQRLVPDDRGPEAAAKTKRILICSGKVYYDLWKERKDGGLTDDVAILRLEQLYPLPEQELKTELAKYPDSAETIWVQEEPQNMGAWWSLRIRLGDKLCGSREWRLASRPESASPSTGSMDMHKLEQKELLEAALHG